MNSALQGALSELKRAGVPESQLPKAATVMSADDGSMWSGTKANGDPWSMTKNNENSYNNMC